MKITYGTALLLLIPGFLFSQTESERYYSESGVEREIKQFLNVDLQYGDAEAAARRIVETIDQRAKEWGMSWSDFLPHVIATYESVLNQRNRSGKELRAFDERSEIFLSRVSEKTQLEIKAHRKARLLWTYGIGTLGGVSALVGIVALLWHLEKLRFNRASYWRIGASVAGAGLCGLLIGTIVSRQIGPYPIDESGRAKSPSGLIDRDSDG